MTQLKAKAVECEIPLVIGGDMTGYLARTGPSQGVHDALMIKCLALSDGDRTVLLIVCDLLALDAGFVAETARAVSAAAGVPAENVVIGCTHTHSGPASIFLQDCGEVDEVWMRVLRERIAACAAQAAQDLHPATLRFFSGPSSVNRNRDTADPQQIESLRDGEVVGFEVNGPDGQALAFFVNYACHATALSHGNRLYSKDFPHALERRLKQALPTGCVVLFYNGCCGNLSPRDLGGGFEAVETTGRALAEDVLRAREVGGDRCAAGPLCCERVRVKVPLVFEHDAIGLKDYLAQQEALYRDEILVNGLTVAARMYRAFARWAARIRRELETSRLALEHDAELVVLRLEGFSLVFLPYEAFHDVGLAIKEMFGKGRTAVACYSNGDFGYLPSEKLYDHGYYETFDSYKYYGWAGPVASAAERTVCEALRSHAG